MKINLAVTKNRVTFAGLCDKDLDKFNNLLPKKIDIYTFNLNIYELNEALTLYDINVCSFSYIEIRIELPRDF
jgi:hypothetical protein